VAKIVALHDVDRTHAAALQRRLHGAPPIVSLPQLIKKSSLVIETASADVSDSAARGGT
jgi:predicted dinucleotide-utilizing enzyme